MLNEKTAGQLAEGRLSILSRLIGKYGRAAFSMASHPSICQNSWPIPPSQTSSRKGKERIYIKGDLRRIELKGNRQYKYFDNNEMFIKRY